MASASTTGTEVQAALQRFADLVCQLLSHRVRWELQESQRQT